MKLLSGKKINIISFAMLLVFIVIITITFVVGGFAFKRNDDMLDKQITALLKENENKIDENEIIDINAEGNREPSLPGVDNPEGGGSVSELAMFDNFIDLFNYAYKEYREVPNLYSVASGRVKVNGKYGPVISLNNLNGKISMIKARNENKTKYFEYYLASLDSTYKFTMFMQSYAERDKYSLYFPETKWQQMSGRDFKEMFGSDMDFWFYYLTKENCNVTKFKFDKYTHKYSATVEVGLEALQTYSEYIKKFLDISDNATFSSCKLTFNFNKYAQFETVSAQEKFHLYNSKNGLNVDVDSVYAETFKVMGDTYVKINKPNM